MATGPLAGKVALVTGASRGIGAAIARRLAADGAGVAVNYSSSPGPAEEVVAAITGAGGRAVAVKADVRSGDDVGRMFGGVEKLLGPVDVLVNNAGVAGFSPIEEFTDEEFARHFDLNVKGLLFCCREAARRMAGRGGSIVNVSSSVTRGALSNTAVYSGTKGAVDAITRVLAADLGPKGIRVNAVLPGFTETDLNAGMPAGQKAAVEGQTALGRLGRPDDIAAVVAFLASPAAGWVTGELVGATGGLRG